MLPGGGGAAGGFLKYFDFDKPGIVFPKSFKIEMLNALGLGRVKISKICLFAILAPRMHAPPQPAKRRLCLTPKSVYLRAFLPCLVDFSLAPPRASLISTLV